MKLARWIDPDGALSEGFVINDVTVPFPDGATVASVLEQGIDGARVLLDRAQSSPGTLLSEVQLLAPLSPSTIRDFVAFEEHVEGVSAGVEGKSNVAAEWYQAPTFYFTNPHTVSGTSAVIRPPVCDRLDFELELAVVIGGGPQAPESNLDVAQSESVIFGYCVMNDWSARDLQAREMQVRLGPAKGKDFGMTLGPWIVTADEFAQYLDNDGFLAVRAEAYVNGELVGEDLVSNMGWPFPELIAYASRNSRVVTGDVLGSGTVGNGGCLGELWGRNGGLVPSPLTPGDSVRLVIEGIGEIQNTVGEPVSAPSIPTARPRTRQRWR
ncbi:fumarylacetoacetate hydrolase family protein [Citricoccus sp.]|uniref:fumarylacetoacetate hydrolase family protein n=1 Tax=Citricoccus sp. TaxID=1978372 RepID=UPI0028BF2D88|nr:fumarylacetoacetate hydrolase family protein [Citricoccus sp.]